MARAARFATHTLGFGDVSYERGTPACHFGDIIPCRMTGVTVLSHSDHTSRGCVLRVKERRVWPPWRARQGSPSTQCPPAPPPPPPPPTPKGRPPPLRQQGYLAHKKTPPRRAALLPRRAHLILRRAYPTLTQARPPHPLQSRQNSGFWQIGSLRRLGGVEAPPRPPPPAMTGSRGAPRTPAGGVWRLGSGVWGLRGGEARGFSRIRSITP